MSLQIHTVRKGSIPEDECITLRATAAINLHAYALVDQTFHQSGKISNRHKHYYRLPNKQVNAGDLIKIYTGAGNSYSYSNRSGTTTYEYYAGLKSCIWNDTDDIVELIRITVEDTYTIK